MGIEERVDRLEKSNRRLWMGMSIAVSLVLLSSILGMKQTDSQENIYAQNFILVDKKGKKVGMFGAAPFMDGGGYKKAHYVSFFSPDGKPRIAMGCIDDNPILAVYKKDGTSAYGFGMDGDKVFYDIVDHSKSKKNISPSIVYAKDNESVYYHKKNCMALPKKHINLSLKRAKGKRMMPCTICYKECYPHLK